MNVILNNPRTSLAGLGAAVVSVLIAFGWVNAEQAAAILGLFVTVGLLLAGDAPKLPKFPPPKTPK